MSVKMGKKKTKAVEEERLKMAQKYLSDMKRVSHESDAESVDSDQAVDAGEVDREIISTREQGKLLVQEQEHVPCADFWSEEGDVQMKRVRLPSTPTACCADDAHVWVATKGADVLKVDTFTGRIIWHRKKNTSKGADKKSSDRNGHKGGILAMAQRGDRLITGDNNGRVVVWHSGQGKPLLSHQQHRGAVTAIAFSTPSEYFTASVDRSIRVWLVDQPTALDTLFGHQDAILDLVPHPTTTDRCLTVGSRDRSARLWRIAEESQLVFRTREHGEGGALQSCAMMSADSFVTGSDEGHLSLWSLGRKKPVFTQQADPNAINCLHAHGDLLLSGHAGWLGLWRPLNDSLQLMRRIPVHGHVNSISTSPDGQRLLVAVGRDERMGRFVKVPSARNELLIITK